MTGRVVVPATIVESRWTVVSAPICLSKVSRVGLLVHFNVKMQKLSVGEMMNDFE